MAESLAHEDQAWTQRLLAVQLAQLQSRLDAVLVHNHQQFEAASWRLEGTNPSDDDRPGTFYGALDDLRDDRAEYADVHALEQLHERMQTLAQERVRSPHHDQGMEVE